MLGKAKGLAALFCLCAVPWHAKAEEVKKAACLTAREFVTVHGYLSDKDRGAIPQDEAVRIATEASAGCENAAQRFIATYDLLGRVNLLGKERAEIALKAALGTDEQAEAFAEIFRAAYLENHLDLDLLTSLRMAKELSLGFTGRTKEAAHDFKDIVKFCVGRDGLGLPRVTCGEIAHRWVKYGENATVGSMATSARELWEFLVTAEEGPKLTAGEALRVLDSTLAKGPEGYENFKTAYRFAMKPGSPLAERNRAVGLALRVARAGLKNTKPESKEEPVPLSEKAATERQ